MKVKEFIKKYDLKIYCEGDFEKEIESGYAGDFLSNTISKAGYCCIWFTVMNNVNVAAVATLIDCSVIMLCENISPDKAMYDKIKAQKINVIGTQLDVYSAIKSFLI
jgi:hypothetical protein